MYPAWLKHTAFLSAVLLWILPHEFVWSRQWDGWVDPVNFAVCGCLWLLFYGVKWSAKGHRWGYVSLIAMLIATAFSVAGYQRGAAHGLTAKYYANDRFEAPVQTSWQYRATDYTRVDTQIAFGEKGFSWKETSFPLAFANDSRVRLWNPNQTASQDGYAFSVHWQGALHFPDDGAQLQIASKGASCHYVIAGITHSCDQQSARYDGVQPIEILFAHNTNIRPSIELQWNTLAGIATVPEWALMPLGINTQTKQSPSESQALSIFQPFSIFSLTGLALWAAAFFALMMQARPQLKFEGTVIWWAIFMLAVYYCATRLAKWGAHFDSLVFEPGHDWLVYETMARDILFGDFLSHIESPLIALNLGYRYFLAGLHILAGEHPNHAVWLQYVLMCFVVVYAIRQMKMRHGIRVAVLFGLLILYGQLYYHAGRLVDTVFAIALSFLCIDFLQRYIASLQRRWLIMASVILGAALLTRANFLPFVGLAMLWLWWVRQDVMAPKRIGDMALLAAISLGIFSVLGIRNYLVAGQWVFMPTWGLGNLWFGHHPPQYDGPNYFATSFPPHEQILPLIFQYIYDEPMAAVERTALKIAYIFGVDLRTDVTVNKHVLIPWLLASAGTFWLWRSKYLRRELVLLWAFIATVNVPLAIIFPWGYGWRLSAPSFLPLYGIAALTLDRLLEAICLLWRRHAIMP